MTDHQELKRLAEAATPGPWYVQYGDDASHRCMTAVSTHNKRLNNQGCFTEAEFESLIAITLHQSYPWVDPDCVNDDANSAYIAAASPDVVLSMIAEIDVQAGSIEAVQAANQRLAAERDKLRTQNQALIEAIKGFHTWAYGQRKQQSKGGHASFDYMELREQMDIAEAALAQAEGGV